MVLTGYLVGDKMPHTRAEHESCPSVIHQLLLLGTYRLEQASQRGCGCPIPGGVQGQIGWGPGLVITGLVLNGKVGGPAYGREVGDS